MKDKAIERAKSWANNKFFDENSRAEIKQLLDNNDTKELVERFYKNLEFGTGGIRSIIGEGTNRINKYTIMKATQALADELNKKGETSKVAISYDSRRKSFQFAKVTASVLAANGIKALIYKRLNPVCLLSFSVRYHQADAGVMITASHNPAEYNGYKVYWNDGCQITAPTDKNIINNYNSITDFQTIKNMNFEDAISEKLVEWVGEEVENEYLKMINSKAINPKMCQEHSDKLKFVYTPIHGAGLIPCTKAFDDLGLTNYHVVAEQKEPHEDFPTVKSPNPENADALKLAVDLLKKTNSDVVFGSDPDADRIGVAVFHQEQIYYLSGNQIGSLLLNYVCENLTEQKRMPTNPYCVKTIVTTNLQAEIANHYGVKIENTLTGFKWICGLMRKIETSDLSRNFLFGTEESFGYLNHDQVRDKDGVAPIALLAEMSLWYKLKGMTLIDALDSLFEKFGFFDESLLNLNYHGADGESKIKRIMERFRSYSEKTFCGERIVITEDYLTQKRKNLDENSETDIDLPQSNVLGLEFESNIKLLLRPSGTEPKIKFYLLIKDSNGTLEERKERSKKKSETFFKFLTEESDKQ